MTVPHALLARLCVCIVLFGSFLGGLRPLWGPAPFNEEENRSGPNHAEYRVAEAGETPVAILPQATRPPPPSAEGWVEKSWSGPVADSVGKTGLHASERPHVSPRRLRSIELRL